MLYTGPDHRGQGKQKTRAVTSYLFHDLCFQEVFQSSVTVTAFYPEKLGDQEFKGKCFIIGKPGRFVEKKVDNKHREIFLAGEGRVKQQNELRFGICSYYISHALCLLSLVRIIAAEFFFLKA